MAGENTNLNFRVTIDGNNEVATALDRLIRLLDTLAVSADDAAAMMGRLDEAMGAAVKTLSKYNPSMTKAGTATERYNVAAADTSKVAKDAAVGLDSQAVAAERVAVSTRGAAVAQKSLNASTGLLAKSSMFLNSSFSAGIIKAGKWIDAGAAITAYEGIKKYMSFQALVTESITQAGVPIKEQQGIMQGLLDISTKTGVKANDMANIFFRVASSLSGSGASMKTMLDISQKIADLNLLGNVAPGAASEATARVVMSLYNANLKGTGHNLNKIIGVESGIAGSSDARLPDVSSAFGNGLTAAAKQYGLSAAEAGSIFSVFTKLGMKPASAGVYASRALLQLFSPTVQGTKALTGLGIDPFKLQHIENTQGYQATLEYLNSKLNGPYSTLPTYAKYKGKTGTAAFQAQLEQWFNGSLSQTFLNQLGQKTTGAKFKAQLQSDVKSGKGITPEDMQVIRNMIITRAFGGQRGSLQMGALLGNLNLYGASLSNILKNSDPAHVKKLIEIAKNTPQQQFKILGARFNAVLIEIGKTITPIFLKLGKAVVGVFEVLGRVKPLLWALLGTLGLISVIGATLKTAQIGFKIFNWFRNIKQNGIMSNVKGGVADKAIVTAAEASSRVQITAAETALASYEKSAASLTLAAERISFGHGVPMMGEGAGVIASEESRVGTGVIAAESGVASGAVSAETAAARTAALGATSAETGLLAGEAGMSLMAPEVMIPLMMSTTLLPMFSGSISKFFSGLFGGKGFTPTVAATRGSVEKSLAQNKKTAANALKNKNIGTGQGIGTYFGATEGANADFAHLQGNWVANNWAAKWQEAQRLKNVKGRGAGAANAQGAAEEAKLLAQLKKNPAFAKYLSTHRAGVYQQAAGFNLAAANAANLKVQKASAAAFGSLITNKTGYFDVMSKNTSIKGGVNARVATDLMGITNLSKLRAEAIKLSKDPKINKSLQEEYKKASDKLGGKIKDLQKTMSDDVKNHKQQIDEKSIDAWAKAAAKENTAAWSAAGITPAGFAAALTTALKGNGPALANIVNTANKNGTSNS